MHQSVGEAVELGRPRRPWRIGIAKSLGRKIEMSNLGEIN